jgi:hypothetical protein
LRTVQTSHFPSPDDISIDALEYLFSPSAKEPDPSTVPWVQMETELPPFAQHQIVRIQTELTIAQRDLRDTTTNLHRACILIGYLQSALHQKEEQLQVLPDLRFKAAESIAYRVDAERCRNKIGELEETVARLQRGPRMNLDGLVNFLYTPIPAENTTNMILFCLGAAVLSVVALCWIRGM